MKEKVTRRVLCGSTFWQRLVVPATMLIVAAASGTTAQSASRDVTGNVVFQIMDYETFGKNERCRYDIPIVNEMNENEPWRYSKYWYFGKCGGEVRAEIHYYIRRYRDGLVDVKGELQLYEGTSADTDDRDGLNVFALDVPQGQTGTTSIHVENTDEGQPDDKADVTLTLHN
ncbi:hypothetical protein ACIGXF_15600 [Streptomyces sp. NPDC053086]|uniref:hypothetical protein n=1 Tax=unclassified Streptomyces TaxID=2593676 RepID=UPI0037CCE5D9